jgi:hypothetical protein
MTLPIADVPDCEPAPERAVTAITAERGQDVLETVYDLMLEDDARALLMVPLFNYADGDHEAIRAMPTHPAGVFGLADGGAHCAMICDASQPTYLLTHWARDRSRGEKLPLEFVVRKQTADTAALYGPSERFTGLRVAPGAVHGPAGFPGARVRFGFGETPRHRPDAAAHPRAVRGHAPRAAVPDVRIRVGGDVLGGWTPSTRKSSSPSC